MNKRLEKYLRDVGSYLVDENREEVLLEIRSHIMEKAGKYPGDDEIQAVLDSMPNPRSLAAEYSQDKEIIAPDLRNFLFLYTSIIFAIHLGALIVASIAGTSVGMFPFFFAPSMDNLAELVLFLPFAFIFDFGLVSLFLFGVSQWAPNLRLPMPDLTVAERKRPGWGSLFGQLIALAVFAAIWHYHDSFVAWLASHAETDVFVILPARDVFVLPLVTVSVNVFFTLLRMLSGLRVLPALGSLATLVGIWLVDALVRNPTLFDMTGEPWDAINRYSFKGLLILIAILTTLDLAKHTIPLFTVGREEGSVSFRRARGEDWLNTFIRLVLYVGLLVGSAIVILPRIPLLWFALVIGGLILLVRWHNSTFGFRCEKCGHQFGISLLTNLISPHGIGRGQAGARGWKLLRCPKCRKFSRATVIRKHKG